LSHNQKKGSLSMVIAKTLATNIDVVEKRKKYLEQINKDKANKRK